MDWFPVKEPKADLVEKIPEESASHYLLSSTLEHRVTLSILWNNSCKCSISLSIKLRRKWKFQVIEPSICILVPSKKARLRFRQRLSGWEMIMHYQSIFRQRLSGRWLSLPRLRSSLGFWFWVRSVFTLPYRRDAPSILYRRDGVSCVKKRTNHSIIYSYIVNSPLQSGAKL